MEVFRKIDEERETDLVVRIAGGDEGAEEQLFERYNRGVNILLNRLTLNSPVLQDLSQETFRIVFQKIREGNLHEPAKLPAFIWAVAHNLVVEHFRKSKAIAEVAIEEAEDIPDPRPDPLSRALQEEKQQIIRKVLDGIKSKRDREILYRFYICEEGKDTICADLGLTMHQFNLVLFRARKQYQRLYENMLESE